MVRGVIALTAVSLVVDVKLNVESTERLGSSLLLGLALFALFELPAFVIVRQKVISELRRSWPDQSSGKRQALALGGALATITIIGGDMVEGAGLFGAVIYMLTDNGYGLIAAATSVVLLLLLFPTYRRIQDLKSKVTGQSA